MPQQYPRILFVGIYDYGLAALEALTGRGFEIAAVVSKPHPPDGTQPVAKRATQKGLPLLLPESPSSGQFIREVEAFNPDLTVVAGYHKKFPEDFLAIPPLGVINLHASLLPAYRGPCPWKWALINGESRTGVTVHEMTPLLDRGDILGQMAFPIEEWDTGESLFRKCCTHAPRLLVNTLERMIRGEIVRSPQDESQASYYGNPSERDACIDWRRPAIAIRNLVRGLHPSPGAWTQFQGRRLTVSSVAPIDGSRSAAPGRIASWDHNGIVVGTASDDVLISQLRLAEELTSGIEEAATRLGIRPGGSFD